MNSNGSRVDWYAGSIAALMMSVTFGILWDDWFFGIAIGVMLGIVAAFSFTSASDE
ncbi:MAG: hypothetical protein ACTMIH_09650 [Microbacterium gubbeenense]|uniref:hypothetical protein n=1 Tax=Microbacterium TaxID=33882 RepID=UPI0004179574|nr:hypothetical protein [Microbacterium gubbeenense]